MNNAPDDNKELDIRPEEKESNESTGAEIYPYDEFVYGNMNGDGFGKMLVAAKEFMRSLGRYPEMP
ncbi:hypothetical protein IKE98_03590 [Candidatus Saccharibacteria bacterium]|nr:hypothetical protein [Candidatus Saccharibacteria bacterium]